MRRPHEPKATDGAKRNKKGVVVARFDDGSVPIHDRPRGAEVIGLVVAPPAARLVPADDLHGRKSDVPGLEGSVLVGFSPQEPVGSV